VGGTDFCGLASCILYVGGDSPEFLVGGTIYHSFANLELYLQGHRRKGDFYEAFMGEVVGVAATAADVVET